MSSYRQESAKFKEDVLKEYFSDDAASRYMFKEQDTNLGEQYTRIKHDQAQFKYHLRHPCSETEQEELLDALLELPITSERSQKETAIHFLPIPLLNAERLMITKRKRINDELLEGYHVFHFFPAGMSLNIALQAIYKKIGYQGKLEDISYQTLGFKDIEQDIQPKDNTDSDVLIKRPPRLSWEQKEGLRDEQEATELSALILVLRVLLGKENDYKLHEPVSSWQSINGFLNSIGLHQSPGKISASELWGNYPSFLSFGYAPQTPVGKAKRDMLPPFVLEELARRKRMEFDYFVTRSLADIILASIQHLGFLRGNCTLKQCANDDCDHLFFYDERRNVRCPFRSATVENLSCRDARVVIQQHDSANYGKKRKKLYDTILNALETKERRQLNDPSGIAAYQDLPKEFKREYSQFSNKQKNNPLANKNKVEWLQEYAEKHAIDINGNSHE